MTNFSEQSRDAAHYSEATVQDALAVVDAWESAFAEADVERMAALYAADALFFGTGSIAVGTQPSDVWNYFAEGLERDRPKTARLEHRHARALGRDVVIVAGCDVVTKTRGGVMVREWGRTTYVLWRSGGVWRFAHFHRSAMPPSAIATAT